MNNPFFQAMGGQNQRNSMIQAFQQFRQSFQGDPRAEVERLVREGKVSQEQLNQAQQMAQQLQGFLK